MHESAREIRAKYVTTMGQRLGDDFAELMQDAARLHLKWNEFMGLFGDEARRAALNKSAPGFFYLTQVAWWNDLILHIFRMTDANKQVLSILKLQVPPELSSGFKSKLTSLK